MDEGSAMRRGICGVTGGRGVREGEGVRGGPAMCPRVRRTVHWCEKDSAKCAKRTVRWCGKSSAKVSAWVKDGVNVGQGQRIGEMTHRWEKDDAKVSDSDEYMKERER